MGEAKRRGVHGGIFGELAPRLFMKAWFEAGHVEQIEFTDGRMADGTWIVVARIGQFSALLTADQIRGVATAFEERLANPDVAPIAQPISDLIVALLQAADELERLHPTSSPITPQPAEPHASPAAAPPPR